MKTLVLFDFDGTLTTKDTMLDFISYSFGKLRLYNTFFVLIPEILLVKLFNKDITALKVKFLNSVLREIDEEKFRELGKTYAKKRVTDILLPKAIQKLKWHKEKGHRIIIVSASIKEWLLPVSSFLGVELICTEYDINKKCLTTKNCIGIEKVNRINESIDLSDYDVIYAYGNSKDDRDMLNIATYPFYREFN